MFKYFWKHCSNSPLYASHRMKRLITNILDSTRLSSGKIDLKLEWCDFEDIVGVALKGIDLQRDFFANNF